MKTVIEKALKWHRDKKCMHLFRACDMQPRDDAGKVHWNCFKCGKEFIESCGLDVLRNGTCDGRWDIPRIQQHLTDVVPDTTGTHKADSECGAV